MLAIVDAYRAGLLKTKNWWPNIIAGTIVGIVALPLAMAFAIASGVKPEQGLYTAIIAAFFVGIFGGSRVQIAGPTGAFIVILANITAQYGVSGLQIATLMAGFILVLMGIANLGSIIKYIPNPVIVGFTAGIGVIIFVGEWKDFFGLVVHYPIDAHFYQKLLMLIQALPHFNNATTLLALLSLLLVLVTPKIFKRIPGPLVAMIVATTFQSIYHFKTVATLGSVFGGIPQHLPVFQIPELGINKIINLIGPAVTIALLGAIESLMSATAADRMAGTRHHSNQELIGQGLANIFSPLFGGIAATGAFARTATNVRNGGNSPIASIIHSALLISVLLLLAPLAASIPLCSLAAILFVVAYNMSDLPHFIHIIKLAPRYDVLVLVTTFLLTVFTDLVIAVNVGVILAMLFFIRRMIQSTDIQIQSSDELKIELAPAGIKELPNEAIVYNIQGPFFFGVAEKIETTLAATHVNPKTIIFRLKNIPFMDITGLATFQEAIEAFTKRNIAIYLCEANSKVQQKLTTMGVLRLIKRGKIFDSFVDIFKEERFS